MKKVVVITLNYNQNDYTINCINSLLKSNYSSFNILLVDNGSTEENYNELKDKVRNEPRVILKRIQDNCGYVGGINYGLEEGIKFNPDYFLIMNNDTIIDKEAINELVNTAEQYEDKAIVSGKVYHYDQPDKLQLIGIEIVNKKLLISKQIGVDEVDHGQFEENKEFDFLDDIFWMLPKDLYQKIGGYSPYFWFNYEQEDFALRAKKAGYKLIYTPKAKLWHKGSATIGGRIYNPNQAYWTTQSLLIFKYLHLKKINFFKVYLKTLESIARTFVKYFYLKLINKDSNIRYAQAKFSGLMYFNQWLFKKNINSGVNPFKN